MQASTLCARTRLAAAATPPATPAPVPRATWETRTQGVDAGMRKNKNRLLSLLYELQLGNCTELFYVYSCYSVSNYRIQSFASIVDLVYFMDQLEIRSNL